MNKWSEMTLAGMARRSDIVVMGITMFFAMGGALLAIFFRRPEHLGRLDSFVFHHDSTNPLPFPRGPGLASED